MWSYLRHPEYRLRETAASVVVEILPTEFLLEKIDNISVAFDELDENILHGVFLIMREISSRLLPGTNPRSMSYTQNEQRKFEKYSSDILEKFARSQTEHRKFPKHSSIIPGKLNRNFVWQTETLVLELSKNHLHSCPDDRLPEFMSYLTFRYSLLNQEERTSYGQSLWTESYLRNILDCVDRGLLLNTVLRFDEILSVRGEILASRLLEVLHEFLTEKDIFLRSKEFYSFLRDSLDMDFFVLSPWESNLLTAAKISVFSYVVIVRHEIFGLNVVQNISCPLLQRGIEILETENDCDILATVFSGVSSMLYKSGQYSPGLLETIDEEVFVDILWSYMRCIREKLLQSGNVDLRMCCANEMFLYVNGVFDDRTSVTFRFYHWLVFLECLRDDDLQVNESFRSRLSNSLLLTFDDSVHKSSSETQFSRNLVDRSSYLFCVIYQMMQQ